MPISRQSFSTLVVRKLSTLGHLCTRCRANVLGSRLLVAGLVGVIEDREKTRKRKDHHDPLRPLLALGYLVRPSHASPKECPATRALRGGVYGDRTPRRRDPLKHCRLDAPRLRMYGEYRFNEKAVRIARPSRSTFTLRQHIRGRRSERIGYPRSHEGTGTSGRPAFKLERSCKHVPLLGSAPR